MTPQELQMRLFGGSPFKDFVAPPGMVPDLQGWLADGDVLEHVIKLLRPSLIVEVGTWKGLSARRMMDAARALGDDPHMICVDTFLGSPPHWIRDGLKASMPIRNGRAALYEQFLLNMQSAGLENSITPLALPSVQAAQVLAHYRIAIPMLYLDASHDKDDVLADVAAWWPLVSPGGVIVGDDYVPDWSGVMEAADHFMAITPDIAVKGSERSKWYAQKRFVKREGRSDQPSPENELRAPPEEGMARLRPLRPELMALANDHQPQDKRQGLISRLFRK